MPGSIIHVGETDGGPDVREQARRCLNYAREEHGHEISDTEISETVEHIDTAVTVTHVPPGTSNPLAVFADHDVERDAASEAIEFAVDTDGVERLIIDRISTLTRTSRSLAGAIDRLNAHNVRVYTVHRKWTFPQPTVEDAPTPGTGYVTENQDTDYPAPHTGHRHTGRPPLGYDVIDGRLRPAENYQVVRAALIAYDAGEITRAQAARKAECSKHSIDRCVEDPKRRERYALP